jgi:hypothetical protein
MLISGVNPSCAVVDRFADHSVEYNIQAEAIKNQNLLNNNCGLAALDDAALERVWDFLAGFSHMRS